MGDARRMKIDRPYAAMLGRAATLDPTYGPAAAARIMPTGAALVAKWVAGTSPAMTAVGAGAALLGSVTALGHRAGLVARGAARAGGTASFGPSRTISASLVAG